MTPSDSPESSPIRREPPSFRPVEVLRAEPLTPHLRRIVLGGDALDGLEIDEPASSVRLLLPPSDGGELVLPTWTGNQFELADGTRAPIRTFTPRHLDTETHELTIDVVLHEGGAASGWAATAEPGDRAAVSGPGRGYEIDATASSYLLAGDETAIPAIAQLLEAMPEHLETHVIIEVAVPEARLELPRHPNCDVEWHTAVEAAAPGTALVDAVIAREEVPPAVWVAGEAAAVQKIRKHLFDERGMTRSAATVRGYWKLGRSAT